MDRNRYVTLAVLAFALILASFIVLGLARIVLPFRIAQLLAAPIVLTAAGLVVYLLAWAILVTLGIRTLEDPLSP